MCKQEKKSNLCPYVWTCDVPVEKGEFIKQCAGSYTECFLVSTKLPKEWAIEMGYKEGE